MYIVIHRQTVSFYQNSSVWLDTQDHSANNRTTFAEGQQQQRPFVYIFIPYRLP